MPPESRLEEDLQKRLIKLEDAWKKFSEMDGDYGYHLEEGGDSKYTKGEVDTARMNLTDAVEGILGEYYWLLK